MPATLRVAVTLEAAPFADGDVSEPLHVLALHRARFLEQNAPAIAALAQTVRDALRQLYTRPAFLLPDTCSFRIQCAPASAGVIEYVASLREFQEWCIAEERTPTSTPLLAACAPTAGDATMKLIVSRRLARRL